MIDEALDIISHDMEYSEYDCSVVSDLAQVRQNIKIRLLLIRGEWFLNSQLGMPLFEEILVKNPDLSAIDVTIKATILETPEVREILTYTSEFIRESRKLTVSFAVLTDYGDLTLTSLEV